jgi:hypothetical protein
LLFVGWGLGQGHFLATQKVALPQGQQASKGRYLSGDKSEALDEFSESVSSTRNMIAHAGVKHSGHRNGAANECSMKKCLLLGVKSCVSTVDHHNG